MLLFVCLSERETYSDQSRGDSESHAEPIAGHLCPRPFHHSL